MGNDNVALRLSDGSGAQVQQNVNDRRRERQRSAGVHQHTGDDCDRGRPVQLFDHDLDLKSNSRTVTAPTKPAWLNFSAGANGSATLSGTPTRAKSAVTASC